MTTRRSFLRQAGLAAAGLTALPPLAGVSGEIMEKSGTRTTTAPARYGVLGLQLYSLRDQLAKDPKAWITKASLAGYDDVETFGLSKDGKFWGMTPAELRSRFRKAGLDTSSGHYGADEYLAQGTWDGVYTALGAIKVLNQRYFVIPFLDESIRKTADDWKRIGDQMNALASFFLKDQILVAYHNHAFEFTQVPGAPTGTRGLDLLLTHTDPGLVDFEMDIYWVVRGGADPVDLIKQYPGRFKMWHLKDMDKANRDLNTEVGSGSIDFKRIFQHADQAGLVQTFMEQENFAMDPYASIRKSAQYIQYHLLAPSVLGVGS